MSVAWKNQAPYALCITHDVDRIAKQWYHYGYYALHGAKIQFRSFREKLHGNEPYWNFYKIMEQEMALQVRSTFLFLNEPVRKPTANFMGRYNIRNPKVRSIILELDRNGFEIGLHGSFYSYNRVEMLRKEKQVLEDILGHMVVSTRQHHLNFDKEVTWRIQSEIGLRNDSTLGYSDRIGEDLPAGPFRTSEGIWEMPITLMDTVAMDTKERQVAVLTRCERLADQGGLLVLNFHQGHYNSTEYPQNVDIYTELLRAAVNKGAWIAPMREIGEWLDGSI